MSHRSALGGALIAATLLLAAPAAHAGQIGKPAPDFTLTDTQGVQQTLSDHLGEVVYLFMVGYG